VELLGALLDRHPALAPLRSAASRLDQLYIPTRYPNSLPGGVPAEVFTEDQATEAIAYAERVLEQAAAIVESGGSGD
jgi:HEPN domain-containing protein